MKNIIKFTGAVVAVIAIVALLANTAKADELSANNGTASSDSGLSSSNGSGADAGSGLSANNGTGTEGSGSLTSNNGTGTSGSGSLSSNNGSGTEGTGSLTSNNGTGTEGTGSTNTGGGTSGGSTGGSSSSSGGSHSSSALYGQSHGFSVTMSGFKIEKGSGNTLIVTWNSSFVGMGSIAYGTVSSPTFRGDKPNFGYAAVSADAIASTTHKVVLNVVPGKTYFLRPLVTLNNSLVFGQEISVAPKVQTITKTTTVVTNVYKPQTVTSTTTVSTPSNDNPFGTVKLTPDSDSNTDAGIILGASTTNANANVASTAHLSFGQKFVNFFVRIWHFLTGKK